MADNTTLNAGTGGDTIASDDIAGVKHQRVKIQFGVDGAATDVSDTNPLPIDDAGGSLTVDGSELTNMETSLGILDNTVSGTEMQVDIVDPGTSATSLGKAVDSASGATDTGIAILAVHQRENKHLSSAVDDYDNLQLSELGGLEVCPEQRVHLDEMDVTTGWTVIGDDTANIATTFKHLTGTAALTFDKVNGAGNTIFAGVQKTITTLDLGDRNLHDIFQTAVCVDDISDVVYAFVRIGTDSSNYGEWQVSVDDLTAAEFNILALSIGQQTQLAITGTGLVTTAISYIAVGVAFTNQTDTLTGIIYDQLGFFTSAHTSSNINSEITSSVNTSNINVQKIGGTATTKGAGNSTNGTQRVTLATDDINLASINTDMGTVAGAVSGTEMQTDIVASLPAGTNLIGDVGLSGARTSGGTTTYRNIDVDETEDDVKTSAGQVYWIQCTNLDATPIYLHLYNATAANVTVGTTTPALTFCIPTQGDSNGAGFVLAIPNGAAFGTAISVAATTTVGGSTGPAANEVILNMGYA